MRCAKCGEAAAEGAAYCANPVCGAVFAGPQAGSGKLKPEKGPGSGFRLDFVAAARLAAFLLMVLTGVYVYFFAAPAR